MMPFTSAGTSVIDLGELVFARELPRGASMLDCLRAVWDEARRDARSMYDAWHAQGGADTYVVYRAAQDRADAAQDTLARMALGDPVPATQR